MRIAALALGIVMVAGACASSGTASTDQTVTARSAVSRTNVITTQEIRDSRAATLADLIRQLRPGWPAQATVFVNNDPDPTGMNRSPSQVSEIRFLSRSEAQAKWGSRVNEVLQIITR